MEAGTGPLVLLLHGFPEFWYSWRHQLPALAEAGFRALAPDLRGYNESERPAGVASYRMEALLDDAAGLIAQAGAERAVVVGHDWGGAIAWQLALARPRLVERLVILNAPHPAAFRRELGDPGQWVRSCYALFFALPGLPEWVLRAGDFALLERAWRRQPVQRGAFTDEDLRRYKQALAQPGALTAGLNYYRAALRHLGALLGAVRPIRAPTLLLWGKRDPYLGVRLSMGLERWVSDLRVVRLHASHWVQNDVPGEVNRLMVEFLRRA